MAAVDGDAPPRELVIDATPAPGDSSDGAGSAMAPFLLTALAAGLLAKYVSPSVALVPLGLAVVVVLVRRKLHEGRFVLRVDDGALAVTRERRSDPAVRIALADLLDVTLDRASRRSKRRNGTPRFACSSASTAGCPRANERASLLHNPTVYFGDQRHAAAAERRTVRRPAPGCEGSSVQNIGF